MEGERERGTGERGRRRRKVKLGEGREDKAVLCGGQSRAKWLLARATLLPLGHYGRPGAWLAGEAPVVCQGEIRLTNGVLRQIYTQIKRRS